MALSALTYVYKPKPVAEMATVNEDSSLEEEDIDNRAGEKLENRLFVATPGMVDLFVDHWVLVHPCLF